MALEKAQIIDAALLLLDEAGIDKFTTRQLAKRLSVQQPALYWHFRNKQTLLDAMTVVLLERGHTYPRPTQGEDWQDYLRQNAHSFRQALLSVRDGARLFAGTVSIPDQLDRYEEQLVFLMDAGFTNAGAMEVTIAIGRYTTGFVLDEQAAERGAPDAESQGEFPLLTEGLAHVARTGSPAIFDAGLRLIIAGAAATLT